MLNFNRNSMIGCALSLLALYAVPSLAGGASPAGLVYKDPNCGCCAAWVAHLRKAGFTVTVNDQLDMQGIKSRLNVPGSLQSCHTARIGEYVVEGHVPAAVIQRLLRERPPVQGAAVPGMPLGSPGMEGGRSQPYQVLTYDAKGATTIYASF